MKSLHSDGPTSLVAQTVKCLPTVRETRVQSLGWEDPLEKEMATHSSILAWEIPWTENPGRLQSMGSQRVRRNFTYLNGIKHARISLGEMPARGEVGRDLRKTGRDVRI